MACWEIILVILVAGLTLMLGVTVVMSNVSRLIDAKTKSRVELQTNLFKLELEYVDRVFDKYMTRIEKMIDKIVNKETPKD